MRGFISKASSLLGKDVATVRRWCERGFIPGAYRTAGGHWRANGFNAKTANAVLRRVREMGFSRKIIPLSTTARVRVNRKKIAAYRLKRELNMSNEMLLRREMSDFHNEYIRRRMTVPGVTYKTAYDPIEFHELRSQKFSDEQIAAYTEGADYGNAFNNQPAVMALNVKLGRKTDPRQNLSSKDEFSATVMLASRRLHLTGAKPTRRNLAREMGIAEVTLKRRFNLWRLGIGEVKRHFAKWIGVAAMPSSRSAPRYRRSLA